MHGVGEVLTLRVVDDNVVVLTALKQCCGHRERERLRKLRTVSGRQQEFLLEREMRVARSLVLLCDGCADVVLTNLGSKLPHAGKATAIASLHEFVQLTYVGAVATEQGEASDPKGLVGIISIGPDLSPQQKQQLEDLSECFSTSSNV